MLFVNTYMKEHSKEVRFNNEVPTEYKRNPSIKPNIIKETLIKPISQLSIHTQTTYKKIRPRKYGDLTKSFSCILVIRVEEKD